MVNLDFYRGKRIFITGHTGFKGSWLCKILADAGAVVTGYALSPPTNPNLFSICEVDKKINSVIGDIRNYEYLLSTFKESNPEIVIHMAAQPVVRESYENPAYTYDVNVMGTVNLLECIRNTQSVKSVLNVTTDKVYHNNEWAWGYREPDSLGGFDPYSNSKSCSELITASYKKSFFADGKTAISTARAGNVIGGGDFTKDRIIPDCIRSAMNNEKIIVRNPHSTRPYQHVLEPLFAYLLILQNQYSEPGFADCYNVGPDDYDCVTTKVLTDLFCGHWGNGQKWETKGDSGPHEAKFLKLDCSKIKATLGWKPRWNVDEAVNKTIEWTRAYIDKKNIGDLMAEQIEHYYSRLTGCP